MTHSIEQYLIGLQDFIRISLEEDLPGSQQATIQDIYINTHDKRTIIIIIKKNGEFYNITYGMPVPANFPASDLFPTKENGHILAPTKPVINKYKVRMYIWTEPWARWEDDIQKIRTSKSNILKYWVRMRNLILQKLEQIGIFNFNFNYNASSDSSNYVSSELANDPNVLSHSKSREFASILPPSGRKRHTMKSKKQKKQKKQKKSTKQKKQKKSTTQIFIPVSQTDPNPQPPSKNSRAV